MCARGVNARASSATRTGCFAPLGAGGRGAGRTGNPQGGGGGGVGVEESREEASLSSAMSAGGWALFRQYVLRRSRGRTIGRLRVRDWGKLELSADWWM